MNSIWKPKNGEIGRGVQEAILEISKCMASKTPGAPERSPLPGYFAPPIIVNPIIS